MKLVALVLAAGSARRFGSDKLSAPFAGEPLVTHAIRAAEAAPVERVIVVCGENLTLPALPSLAVETLRLASHALSESLGAGLAAAGEADGAFVFLGDMPLVAHGVAARLAPLLGEQFAAVPRHAGRPGHPVLLARRAFAEVARLGGDEGAGRLLKRRSDVAYLDWPDDTILLDIDRTDDIARLEGRRAGG